MFLMRSYVTTAIGAAAAAMLTSAAPARADATLTIATVNNGDMVVMQRLSPEFEKQHPDIHLRWVVLEENVLRQRVTTDIATHAGQFDIVTVGNYEVPIWAKQGWLEPIDNLPASYDVDDLLKPVREGLTYEGKLYGLPFYGESAMTYYRTDLFEKAGLKMPDAADLRADPRVRRQDHRQGEPDLRHVPARQAGLGREHGVRDHPGQHLRRPVVQHGVEADARHAGVEEGGHVLRDILKADGPPGATSNGFNENLALFSSGHCGDMGRRDRRRRPALRQEAVAGGRQGGLRGDAGRRASQGPDLAVELEPRHSGLLEAEGCRQDLRHLGDVQGLYRAGRQGERLGRRCRPAPAIHLRQARIQEGRAVRGVRREGDRDRQPERQTRKPRPTAAPSSSPSPNSRASARRSARPSPATLTGQTTVDQALRTADAATERVMRQAGYGR